MKRQPLLLGLDVGTTHIKGILFDPQAAAVTASARMDTPGYEPRPGWREHDPATLWDRVRACIRQLTTGLEAHQRIEGVAAASMGEAGALYDAGGRPLCPIIAWHDPRTAPQRDWWTSRGDPYDLYRVTGQHLTHIFGANKLLWIRQHWPEAWEAAAAWRCVEDAINWHLCGAHATDYTMASRTMLLDQEKGIWAAALLDEAGIPAHWLPELGPSGRMVGAVSPGAAAETGLLQGTPVAAGGHDHLCAALACGCIGPGDFLDSMGTSDALLWITDAFRPSRALYDLGYSHYRHTVPGAFLVQGGLDTGGAYLQWAARLLGLEGAADLAELAAGAEPGAGGVTALPFLLGRGTPRRDHHLRAALAGLTPEHTQAQVARACVEALGHWLGENVEALSGLLGQQPGAIIATGGGNALALVPQVKADATGIPVRAPDLAESAALGAALLAGMGSGRYASAQEAQAALRYDTRTYPPDPDRYALYTRLRAGQYAPLSEALHGWHR